MLGDPGRRPLFQRGSRHAERPRLYLWGTAAGLMLATVDIASHDCAAAQIGWRQC